MANPNPVRRLTPEELAEGRRRGVQARLEKQAERLAFEQSFAEVALAEGEEPAARRVRIVAVLMKQALEGKPWALTLCLEYLFGKPKAEVIVRPPPSVPKALELPEELREPVRRLRERLRREQPGS